ADAAQLYYQPIVSLGAGYNTNVNLDPLHKESAVGYFADAAVNLGIATPRSEWTLQPRLTYNYYPSVQERNRLEAFLNSYTRYSWERDRLTLVGFFDHRDDVNAEQPGAEDNPVNPGVGNTPPGTGHPALGITRNYVLFDPSFSHLLTPLSSIGFAGDFQRMDFSTPDRTSHVPFNYYQGRVFYARTLDPRTDFAIGA